MWNSEDGACLKREGGDARKSVKGDKRDVEE